MFISILPFGENKNQALKFLYDLKLGSFNFWGNESTFGILRNF